MAINPISGQAADLSIYVKNGQGSKYVSNGALIAAVIHVGIPYRFWSRSPNIKIALSTRAVQGTATGIAFETN